jgi:hypothetical protein
VYVNVEEHQGREFEAKYANDDHERLYRRGGCSPSQVSFGPFSP